ncbi:MAG: hypothetical protein WKG07_21515 [Hymenobacter sp.]
MSAGVGWGGLAWLSGAALVLARQMPVVLGSPLDVRSSDVIPIVQTYVARFSRRPGGVPLPHQPALPLFPNHLPAYVAALRAVAAAEDRFSVAGLGPAAGGWHWGLPAGSPAAAGQLAPLRAESLVPAVVLWQVGNSDPALYAQVEPTIIAYYFLLAASLLIGPAWAQGGALVLCLLSRYSVIFWVPLFVDAVAGSRAAARAAGDGHHSGRGAGIYIIPFLSATPPFSLTPWPSTASPPWANGPETWPGRWPTLPPGQWPERSPWLYSYPSRWKPRSPGRSACTPWPRPARRWRWPGSTGATAGTTTTATWRW